jgi:hypothetical protein
MTALADQARCHAAFSRGLAQVIRSQTADWVMTARDSER